MLCVILCLVLLAAVAGCEKKGGSRGSSQNSVDDILQKGMNEEDKKNGVTPGGNETNPGGQTATPDVTLPTGIPDDGQNGNDGGNNGEGNNGDITGTPDPSVDVDLTCLSSTMVYAEVYNIVSAPDEYIGKTMKMDGLFAVYHDEETDQYYYACLIQDATACCQNGIEFVPADAKKYPEDFPELGTTITVTGVFDTYQEGGYTYCTLREAKLIG